MLYFGVLFPLKASHFIHSRQIIISGDIYEYRSKNQVFPQIKRAIPGKLAWEAGINPAFLGELERGQKSPTLKTLEKITDALSIHLYELFAGPGTLPVENDKELSTIMESLRALPPQQIHQMSVIIQTILEIKNSSI